MRVGYLPGDGIGPEVLPWARRAVEALEPSFEFMNAEIGTSAYKKAGDYLPQKTLDILDGCDSALFGAITSPPPDTKGYRSIVPELRRHFDLYINLRPARSLLPADMLPLRRSIDIVVVRENTEGPYIQRERETEKEGGKGGGGNKTGDVEGVIAESLVTRKASQRICRFAFEYARKHGRKKITCVHKANVLRKSDGLFRRVFLEEAKEHPDIKAEECYVDAAAMFLVTDPDRFDVIVTTNLYGDILSDLTAGIIGGLGYAPSGNIGDRFSIFEPVHGSAPDIAGKGIANPTAAFLTAAMMLEHLGKPASAQRIRSAVEKVIAKGKLTKDSGGKLTTEQFGAQVVKDL